MFFARLRALPRLQRQTIIASTATLFLTLAGHQLMETSRDALFLSSIPATQLPWVYLVIAVASLGIARGVAVARHLVRPSRLIVVWILFTSAVTFAFSALTPRQDGEWLLYGLYIWTGIVASVTLLQFWTMISGISTIEDAKESFAIVGTGSVLGAIAGSAVATSLAQAGLPDSLLTAAGALLAVSAVGPFILMRMHGDELDAREPDEARPDLVSDVVNDVFGRPYVRTLLLMVFVSMGTVTILDFVFKSIVSEQVAAGSLTRFFAWFYLAVNVVSFAVQSLGVRPLLRKLTVTGSLALMPALLFGSTVALLLGGGVIAAIALRGVDGSLRHSLNRTATEILYVPMKGAVRRRVKAFIDVVGHRGAQAAISLGILVSLRLGAETKFYVWGIAAGTVLWLGTLVALRIRYVDVFRDRLNLAVDLPEVDLPELDISSLESLFEALSEPDDRRVLAALDLLEQEQRVHLVPTLIVYHPSEEVVLRALDLFAKSGRTDFLPHAARLEQMVGPGVRAGLVSAAARAGVDSDYLQRRLDHGDALVAAVAAVFLHERDELDADETEQRLRRALAAAPEGGAVIGRALAEAQASVFEPIVLELLSSPDLATRRAAIACAPHHGTSSVALALRNQLGDRELRPQVCEALVQMGDKGLAALKQSLNDTSLDARIRWQAPEALRAFGPRAAPPMWEAFEQEPDGVVRHRLLRELDRLHATHGELEIDREAVSRALDETIRRAWEYRHWRSIVESQKDRTTSSRRLLCRMLSDKQTHCIDTALRLVTLHTDGKHAADYAKVREGLRSSDPGMRASSTELLDHVVEADVREKVLQLFDDSSNEPPDEYAFLNYPFEELLARMIGGSSELLALLAVRVAADAKLHGLREVIEARREDASSELLAVINRAEVILGNGSTHLESA